MSLRLDLAKAGFGFSHCVRCPRTHLFSWVIRVVFAAHGRKLDSRLLPRLRVESSRRYQRRWGLDPWAVRNRQEGDWHLDDCRRRLLYVLRTFRDVHCNALRVMRSSPPNEFRLPSRLDSYNPLTTTNAGYRVLVGVDTLSPARPTTNDTYTRGTRRSPLPQSLRDHKLIDRPCPVCVVLPGRLSKELSPRRPSWKGPSQRLSTRTVAPHQLTLTFLEDPGKRLRVCSSSYTGNAGTSRPAHRIVAM
ncbi:hypothetical protein C8F01DRAFT_636606 [Mycena amicta]|nr:hypothetical protein C8F01DRAFT_636606 [Mycena amicta]